MKIKHDDKDNELKQERLKIVVAKRECAEIKRDRDKLKLEAEKLKAAKESGKWMEQAEHNRILAGLGKIGRDNLWEKFDQRCYALYEEQFSKRGMPEDWLQIALEELRQLNPKLLMEYHSHLESLIKEEEKHE